MHVVTGKMKGADVEERPVASTQRWIACLSARAQSKLLGETVSLPQGLNGTLVRAVGPELLPSRCHLQPYFKEAVAVWSSAPCPWFQTDHLQALCSHSTSMKAKLKKPVVFSLCSVCVVPDTLQSHPVSRVKPATNRPQVAPIALDSVTMC